MCTIQRHVYDIVTRPTMHRYIFVLGEIVILLSLATRTSSRGNVVRLENAALNKPTVQGPSTYRYLTHLYESSFAVDGNPSNLFPDCAGVASANVMWWIVDLKRSRKIHTVLILTKRDLVHHMENFTIDMFNEDPRQLAGFPNNPGHTCASQFDPIPDGEWSSFVCGGIINKRFVRVVKHGGPHNLMALCEVEVLSEPMSSSSGHAYNINPHSAYPVSAILKVGAFKSATSCAVALAENTVHTGFQYHTENGQCFMFETSPLTGDTSLDASSNWITYIIL